MSYTISRTPVKLIIGLITQDPALFDSAEKIFLRKFGPIDFKSQIIPFNHTQYYEAEFGQNLKRKFFSFKKLIKREKIINFKLATDRIEKIFISNSNRKINIDPGYISSSKLILTTRKDYRHRIYLGKGVFAEVTLYYQKGTFCSWEWTYPDYKTKGYNDIFNEIRDIYMKQIGGL